MHPTAINYLTYLVLNKRKLDNNQQPKCPPRPRLQSKTAITKINHTRVTCMSPWSPHPKKDVSVLTSNGW
jgi:hypothetical protein